MDKRSYSFHELSVIHTKLPYVRCHWFCALYNLLDSVEEYHTMWSGGLDTSKGKPTPESAVQQTILHNYHQNNDGYEYKTFMNLIISSLPHLQYWSAYL